MERAGEPGVHIPAYSAGLEKVHSKDNSQGQEFCISIPDLLTCRLCTGGPELRYPQGSEQGSMRRASLDVHPINCWGEPHSLQRQRRAEVRSQPPKDSSQTNPWFQLRYAAACQQSCVWDTLGRNSTLDWWARHGTFVDLKAVHPACLPQTFW